MIYYLYHNEVQRGPYTIGQVRSLWMQGTLTADVLYYNGENVDWRPLAEIADRLEGVSGNAAQPPPIPKKRHPVPSDTYRPGTALVARDGENLGYFSLTEIDIRMRSGQFDGSEWVEVESEWLPIDYVWKVSRPQPGQLQPQPAVQAESNTEKALQFYLTTEACVDIARLFFR